MFTHSVETGVITGRVAVGGRYVGTSTKGIDPSKSVGIDHVVAGEFDCKNICERVHS